MKKEYNIIYADPPWRYGNGRHGPHSVERHYPTMSMEEISALPVVDIAAKDSVLFLWVTFPMLHEAFHTIEAWGFRYKSVAFIWAKQNRLSKSWFMGMGYWTRANAEICLLATKGKPKRKNASVHQLIVTPIEEHSKKPEQAREKIVTLLGDLPRLELFARQYPPGWDVWGNEVDSADLGPKWPEVLRVCRAWC